VGDCLATGRAICAGYSGVVYELCGYVSPLDHEAHTKALVTDPGELSAFDIRHRSILMGRLHGI
jgi:hypothetical protein